MYFLYVKIFKLLIDPIYTNYCAYHTVSGADCKLKQLVGYSHIQTTVVSLTYSKTCLIYAVVMLLNLKKNAKVDKKGYEKI